MSSYHQPPTLQQITQNVREPFQTLRFHYRDPHRLPRLLRLLFLIMKPMIPYRTTGDSHLDGRRRSFEGSVGPATEDQDRSQWT